MWLYINGSLEKYLAIVNNIPSSRTWAGVPGALQNLAATYNEDEAGLFTRDIGTLYGGLKDRFDASAWEAISHPNNPVQVWAYVRCSGLPIWLTGVNDRDANVHHWAWGVAMGGEYGPGGSLINTGREMYELLKAYRRHEETDFGNAVTDVRIGNAGVAYGFGLRVFGLQHVDDLLGLPITR